MDQGRRARTADSQRRLSQVRLTRGRRLLPDLDASCTPPIALRSRPRRAAPTAAGYSARAAALTGANQTADLGLVAALRPPAASRSPWSRARTVGNHRGVVPRGWEFIPTPKVAPGAHRLTNMRTQRPAGCAGHLDILSARATAGVRDVNQTRGRPPSNHTPPSWPRPNRDALVARRLSAGILIGYSVRDGAARVVPGARGVRS